MLRVERLALAHAADLRSAGLAGPAAERGPDEALHGELLEQVAGAAAHFVVLDDGDVVGRVDLTALGPAGEERTATLGYRVAPAATGRGVATAAVGIVLDLAARELGVTRVVAVTAADNPASQRVLARNGFALVGPVVEPDGEAGLRYEKVLR